MSERIEDRLAQMAFESMFAEGLNPRDIASMFGCTVERIYQMIEQHGVVYPPLPKPEYKEKPEIPFRPRTDAGEDK